MRAPWLILTAILLLTQPVPQAHSEGAGPLHAVAALPMWVRDINGVQLQLCRSFGGIDAPLCPPHDDAAASRDYFEGGIGKATYYSARADVELGDGTRVAGVFFVEATAPGDYGPPFLKNGIRIEIRLPNAAASDKFFAVTSPWNDAATIRVPAGDTVVESTLPLSVVAYGPDFGDVMSGPVTVFIGNNTPGCADGGILGDGVSLAPLAAPGPAGVDTFSVTEVGVGTAVTRLFVVRGRLFAPAAQNAGGFAVERATVSEVGAVSIGTLIAATSRGDGMQIKGAGGVVFDPPIVMVPDGSGRFFANFPAANLLSGPFPVMIDVTVTRGGEPIADLAGTQAPMTDLVIVRNASYSIRTRTLTVSALSSTQGSRNSPVTLHVRGSDAGGNPVGDIEGPITGRSLVLTDVAVPPSYVTVTSSRGGRQTVPVIVR